MITTRALMVLIVLLVLSWPAPAGARATTKPPPLQKLWNAFPLDPRQPSAIDRPDRPRPPTRPATSQPLEGIKPVPPDGGAPVAALVAIVATAAALSSAGIVARRRRPHEAVVPADPTRPPAASPRMRAPETPDDYIRALEEPRRSEVRTVHDLIRETVPGSFAHIRSGAIAYGTDRRRRDARPVVRLASTKRYISVYVTPAGGRCLESYADRLPNASLGKRSIRFKRIADIDVDVLRELLAEVSRGASSSAGQARLSRG